MQGQHLERRDKRRQDGFSLIELLIVMVILGLLASLVGPQMFKHLGGAKQKTAKTQIEMLMTAMDAFRLDLDRYPTQQEGLEALTNSTGDETWQGPYLKKGVPLDPWGKQYHYQIPGEKGGEMDIFSYGRDDKPGGEGEDADIASWE